MRKRKKEKEAEMKTEQKEGETKKRKRKAATKTQPSAPECPVYVFKLMRISLILNAYLDEMVLSPK